MLRPSAPVDFTSESRLRLDDIEQEPEIDAQLLVDLLVEQRPHLWSRHAVELGKEPAAFADLLFERRCGLGAVGMFHGATVRPRASTARTI